MMKEALVPAAGRGLRLDRPGTPKPLVDVDGQAMVVRLLKQLERAGVERIAVVVGYGGEKVRRAIVSRMGLHAKIEIIENPTWETGLAGSLLAARDFFSGPFLIAMSDHVFDEALIKLMASQEVAEGSVSALVGTNLENIFTLDTAVKVKRQADRVVEIDRNLEVFDAVDAGLFAATPEIFNVLDGIGKDDQETDLTHGLQQLAGAGKLQAVPFDDCLWDDVDTPADLIHAEMRLRRQRREDTVTRPNGIKETFEGEEYRYVVGKPETARIIVGRGFVREPEQLMLIPQESASSPIFVFTDETVGELYGMRFVKKLKELGYDIHSIVLPDGEESKSLANYSYLVERVLSRGVDERSVFVSLGGGVVCNVCGFVASTIYRGLDLVHLPTTMMAQCDAAISHKQAINGYRGKNMVGSYYQPRLVAADVETLNTLPSRLKGDGLAEVIKHAVGQDPAYVEMLLSHSGNQDDIDFLEKTVRRNVELKCDLAVSDPKELREAMILQYGHTVGHPIEHLSGYNMFHGESVAIGMMVAARVSRLLGACDDALVDLHEQLCSHYGLPTRIPQHIRVGDILNSLKYNKRYLTEGTRMALLTDVGVLWNVDGEYAIPVSDQVLAEAIELTMEE
jgi:3-dehydroquinate synthase